MYARENGKNRPRTADRALVHLAASVLLLRYNEQSTVELQADQIYWLSTDAASGVVAFLIPEEENETGFAIAAVRLQWWPHEVKSVAAEAYYATIRYKPAPMSLVADKIFGGRPAGVREPKKKGKAKKNPASVEAYEPSLEQIRAQRQAIYESSVKAELGKLSAFPFHDEETYRRLDLRLRPEVREELIRRMFRIGTGVQQRDGRLQEHSQKPTAKTVRESRARYQDPHHLLLNRQAYEETLGMNRRSGFHRITQEPTADGLKFFVWPLPLTTRKPMPFDTYEEAEAERERVESFNPLINNRWWVPYQRYTDHALRAWLPPASYWRAALRGSDERP